MTPTQTQWSPSEGAVSPMEGVPYRSLLGCLQYIANRCRPDTSYQVAVLSQFCERHGPEHWKSLIKILMYLASTKNLGLRFILSKPPLQMTVFVDASWASNPDDRKSWTAYSLFLNGIPITWRVVKQSCVALSPMEAEFIAASEAVKELKFLKACLDEISVALNFRDSCCNTETNSYV